MAQEINFPSVTEIYGALMTNTGPRAYVPKLSRAINKMVDEPTMDNLHRAKQVAKNPVIQAMIDAMFEATTAGRYEDDVMDIQYGIIASLNDKEYTQLPWLVDKIKDLDLQHAVLDYYRVKYTAAGYDKQWYAHIINQRADKDYLSKCIIEIYLSLIMHPKTPYVRTDDTHRNIEQISDEFLKEIRTNSKVKKEVEASLPDIFTRIQKAIDKELAKSTPDRKQAAGYASLGRRLTAFVRDEKEIARLKEQFDGTKILNPQLVKVKPKKQEKTDGQDAYDKLKGKWEKNIDKLKKKVAEISEKPGIKKAKKQAGDILEDAARKTVNAIDSGIKKIKKKATRENFEKAIDSIEQAWAKFITQFNEQQKKKA